ncbi:MAG: lipoprotein signal peptidase LspA [Phormidesmis priestleyi Ana]|uniref:Lipoprotein signal peptidase n=1 Tax=Phormidesmis priestleyi Ana TaxID=1666911 RepID=A0A0P7YXJ1_9CYAN|nr:MAG: lipoprotein signal peptidase LspA [Phormidesmis priestleyi Ana]
MRVKNSYFWLVAIAGVILDQLTKFWTVQTLPLNQGGIEVIPNVLYFFHTTNTGAAWSLFSENGGWLRWLSLLVSLVLIGLGLFARWPDRWEEVGYGFILSGAFGNGIDRFLTGEVVDFLQVFPATRFPVFNLADVWINIGFICLVKVLLFEQPSTPKK